IGYAEAVECVAIPAELLRAVPLRVNGNAWRIGLVRCDTRQRVQSCASQPERINCCTCCCQLRRRTRNNERPGGELHAMCAERGLRDARFCITHAVEQSDHA